MVIGFLRPVSFTGSPQDAKKKKGKKERKKRFLLRQKKTTCEISVYRCLRFGNGQGYGRPHRKNENNEGIKFANGCNWLRQTANNEILTHFLPLDRQTMSAESQFPIAYRMSLM